MTDDRRSSLRRLETLPFAWCPADSTATVADLCSALALPRSHALQSRLAELDDDLTRAAGDLPDSRVAEVVRILDAKLAILQEGLLADASLPAPHALELSAEGVGFRASRPLDPGTWVGVHLVLPVNYHLICRARVTHCSRADEPDADGQFHIGTELHGLETAAARRLTRHLIGTGPRRL